DPPMAELQEVFDGKDRSLLCIDLDFTTKQFAVAVDGHHPDSSLDECLQGFCREMVSIEDDARSCRQLFKKRLRHPPVPAGWGLEWVAELESPFCDSLVSEEMDLPVGRITACIHLRPKPQQVDGGGCGALCATA